MSKIRETKRKQIPVTIDGIIYRSINAASIALGLTKYQIRKTYLEEIKYED